MKANLRRKEQAFIDVVSPLLQDVGINPSLVQGIDVKVGRNQSAVLEVDGNQQYFVKLIQGSDGVARFRRSKDFENWVINKSIKFATPKLLAFSKDQRALMFEFARCDTNLGEMLGDKFIDSVTAMKVAVAIGSLHTSTVSISDNIESDLPVLPPQFPGLISLDYFENATIGERNLWRILQNDAELLEALDLLVDSRINFVPIHGDFRPDQVFFRADEVVLLDFEEFRLGDPARDLGSFIGDLFYHKMSWIAVGAQGTDGRLTHESLLERGVDLLGQVRPIIQSFWEKYCIFCCGAQSETWKMTQPNLANRVTGYAGWHLFDRSLARSALSGRLTANDRALNGIGRNLIINSGMFAQELGLGE
ncbi:phosphotransferase [Corynebacterium durum]|uniref:phosphotransferase n=1 Tax=Corynebacterium durum TaxID=61592 RepID=UPI000347B612|nr:phosphotransferase [Corynebacterium durum]